MSRSLIPFLAVALGLPLAGCGRDDVATPRRGELPPLADSDPASWPLESTRPRLAAPFDPTAFLGLPTVEMCGLPRELQDDYFEYYEAIPRQERRAMPVGTWNWGILETGGRWSPTCSPMFGTGRGIRSARLGDRALCLHALEGRIEWADDAGRSGRLVDEVAPSRFTGWPTFDVAVLGNELLLAWADTEAVRVASVTASGEGLELGAVHTLQRSTEDGDLGWPMVVADGGRAHVLWKSTCHLRVSSSTRPGGEWEPAYKLSERVNDDFACAPNGEDVWVAWSDSRYGDPFTHRDSRKLFLTRSEDGGRSWMQPACWNRPSDEQDCADEVRLVALADRAVVHWSYEFDREGRHLWRRAAVSPDLRVRSELPPIPKDELRSLARERARASWSR